MADQNAAGVVLGRTTLRGRARRILLPHPDRLHHVYLLGKTGTGKTTVMQQMALQDIRAGNGCCFVDPHGDAITWLLERTPAERLEDVVLFDAADREFPMGLNLLEPLEPSQQDFLVAEAIDIFYKLFDPNREGLIGPQFEHWMRNGALTVMADPDGGTLLEIPRLFTDPDFERRKRRFVRDATVRAFWEQQLVRTSEFHRSEMLNYFTSKFGRFLANRDLRNIVGQPASAFQWREVLAHRKVVLVNLAKGIIGELNASMLGLMLMTKLAAAVLQRADRTPEERTPFFLYVDEFQNVLTDAFLSLLTEARKYGLSVTLAHQYLEQLPETLRSAVLGNVRTILAFQLGAPDAAVLLRELDPEAERRPQALDADTLQRLPPHHFAIRLSAGGTTYPAFLGETERLPDAEAGVPPEVVRTVSQLRYATPRHLVEAEFRARWRSP